MRVDADDVQEFMVRSPSHGHVVLIVGMCSPLRERDLVPFETTDETTDRVITREPVELAFPIHTEALARWFSRR